MNLTHRFSGGNAWPSEISPVGTREFQISNLRFEIPSPSQFSFEGAVEDGGEERVEFGGIRLRPVHGVLPKAPKGDLIVTCCHTFRGPHERQPYDRTAQDITLDEIERIGI